MPAPSPRPSTRVAYEELLRERYGDISELAEELQRPEVPPPPPGVIPERRRHPRDPIPRTPLGAGRYADDHARVLRWIKRSHPDWRAELCMIGAGGVAHVVTSTVNTRTGGGYSLCGKRGTISPAPDDVPVCRVCTA